MLLSNDWLACLNAASSKKFFGSGIVAAFWDLGAFHHAVVGIGPDKVVGKIPSLARGEILCKARSSDCMLI